MGCKLLGFYEEEVQNIIANYSRKGRNTFCDIGGADGYFAVGVLVADMFDRCIVYEASEIGRKQLKINSELNNVEQKITIRGEVNRHELVKLLDEGLDLSDLVILCDIEGAEFDIFDDEIFEGFC